MRKRNRLLALFLATVMAFSTTAIALADDEESGEGEETVPAYEVPEDAEGSLVILHSNDVHGAIEGYAKMATLKAMYEEAGAEVLVMDAGDFSQGETSVSISEGVTAVELMNMVAYDVAAPGNHEFDYGYENLTKLVEAAAFPILAANIDYEGELAFDANVVLTTENGVKVGVFGLDTPETATKAHPAKIKGVTFSATEELYADAQEQVDALEEEACDYIICLGHLGIDDESKGNRSIDLLENVTGIDVFIDGHSHSTLEDIQAATDGTGKVGDTYLTSTGTKFANIGVITIKDDEITTENVNSEAITVAEDDPIAARAQEIRAEIEEEYGAKFASTEILLNGDRDPGNRTEETNLGDLITDAILWYATKDGALDVPEENIVALTNGGGIRAPIEAGDITKNDVNTVLPFGNTVAYVSITGEALLEALEASTYCTPTAVGGFPQVSGIAFTIDVGQTFDEGDLYPGSTYAKPNSINRVTIDSINGQEFDPEATYIVVTNDFVAAGGDTYYAFSVANVVDTGVAMDVALMDYIAEVLEGTITAEAYGETKDRITIVGTPAQAEDETDETNETDGTDDVTNPTTDDITFSDVPENMWYTEYVKEMAAAGVVNGFGDGTFKPDDYVTWEQALQMALSQNGYTAAEEEDGWLITAQTENLLTGDVDLDAYITREAFCQLLGKAMKLDESTETSPFTDTEDGYVVLFNTMGVIEGYGDGTFGAENSLTRAAVCKILSESAKAVAAA